MNENDLNSGPPRRSNRPNWNAIKRAYQAGACSLPELARRYKVALSTLQKRCCREHWRDQMQRYGDVVETSAMVEATELGRDLARRGAAFLERCLRDDEQFHARIMSELDRAENGDVQAVKTLVSAWRDLVSMSRISHGLDSDGEKRPRSLVEIQCVGEVNVGPGGTLPDGMEPAVQPIDLPDLDALDL